MKDPSETGEVVREPPGHSAGETEHRTPYEEVPVGIVKVATDGRIFAMSHRAAQILGYDSAIDFSESLKDTGDRVYVRPSDRERLLQTLGQSDGVIRMEAELYRKDASILRALLNLECIYGAQHQVIGIEGTIQDIAALLKVEETLIQAQERYRGIFENATEGMFRTTPEGQIISANPSLARMLGYESPEELTDLMKNMIVQLFSNPKRRDEYVQLLEIDGVVSDFEAQVYGKDRSVLWVTMNARRVTDAEGKLVCYEGTIEDTTQRKKLETQLRNAQRMESIGTLAGGVAHDFNNVLTTIMGYCSLITMKAGKGNPMLGYIDQIMEAANRASTLTHSLLSFNRKQISETKAIDVNETIKGVEKLLRRVIGEDIELLTALSPEKLIVIVGDGQIGQLLMNLATNAKDAMPDGGVLRITTEQVHLSGDITRKREASDGLFAAIGVSDTGTGMDDQTRDQIFDPFFTTKEVGKGSGLGLSIVYGIVKQNNGFIDVASTPGHGTAITVYLPLAQPSSDSSSLDGRAELQGGTETILVAEDNGQVREIVTTTLRDFGYRVIEACDGADAIERFDEHGAQVDLLLLDVIMPKKNGKETYLEIKKRKPDIRTIFVSGYTGDILTRKGISREGIPMISKPIVIERLLAQIRDTLDRTPTQLTLFP